MLDQTLDCIVYTDESTRPIYPVRPEGLTGFHDGLPPAEPGDYDPLAATLGYCLGAYRYTRFRPAGRAPARLFCPPGHETSQSQAAAIWMVRDLINTPANILGPVELADFAVSLGNRHGASSETFADDALRAS
jgi:hypothetical protein